MTVTRTDIANRAVQRCGATAIAAGALLTENSVPAIEIRACYDSLRRAELRRNVWRCATRKVILRAFDTNTEIVTFLAYAAGTSYAVNSLVSSGGSLWSSSLPDKIAAFTVTVATPAVFSLTAHGFVAGTPITLSTTGALPTGLAANTVYYVIAAGLTANAFEVSATLAGAAINTTGTQSGVHTVTAGMNIAHTPSDDVPTYWTRYFGSLSASPYDSETTYNAGELVFDTSNIVYMSRISGNEDTPPTVNWRILTGATLAGPNFIYPIGAGPVSQSSTLNVFMLPNGFLREAPADPRAGQMSVLGFPSNTAASDWVFEANYILTHEAGPILLRFSADIGDPNQFDPMLVEGLGARIAMETVERLTQSTAKLQMITTAYDKIMGEARTVNGIENGPVSPPLDDYLACRG